MGVYRKIEQQLWTDEKFMNLSPIKPSGQSLWIYLLTGPQVGIIPGLYVAGRAFLAESLGWESKAFREAFREVLAEGLLQESPKERLIWIPNALKYNMPASPNVIRSWQNSVRSLPKCPLYFTAIASMRKSIEDKITLVKTRKSIQTDNMLSEAFLKAFDEVFGEDMLKALPKPSPNTEQEQEQEQEEKRKREELAAIPPDFDDDIFPPDVQKTPPLVPTFGTSLLDSTMNRIIDYWNSKGLIKTSHFISMSTKQEIVSTYDNACKNRTFEEICKKIDEYAVALPGSDKAYRYRSFANFMAKGLDREYDDSTPDLGVPAECGDTPDKFPVECPTCHVPLIAVFSGKRGCPECRTTWNRDGTEY